MLEPVKYGLNRFPMCNLKSFSLMIIFSDQNLAESGGDGPAHSPPSQHQGQPSMGPAHSQSQGQPSMVPGQPDLYVDIPHTYVNVYDESQVRGK